MAATFNSPPGWPTPPEGWTPPPGWTPDPSWPPAPQGWQFWSDSGDGSAPGDSDLTATQSMGTSPTQALPQQSSAHQLYSYAPSAGLEEHGASPYAAGSPGQSGGYVPVGSAPSYQGPAGPPPPKRGAGVIVAVVIVAALVLGGIGWGVSALLSGGGDPDPDASTPVSSGPTDDGSDPTTDPTTPTSEPTDDATDDPTDQSTGSSDAVDLTGGEPALATTYGSTDPIAEVRLLSVQREWQPDDDMFCSAPQEGEYLALEYEVTTTAALADADPATYSFLGLEIGAELDGAALEANGWITTIICVDEADQIPSEMGPGETATGLVILDVPSNVTAVTYTDFLSSGATYRWILADQ